MLQKYNLKIRPVEMILGLGLGLGYMTSLRFSGLVGIAELLVLVAIFLLFQLVGKSIVRYEKSVAGLIKIYMILAVYILFPIMTLVTTLFVGLKTDPQYIIAFMMGITLAFLLVEALRAKKINMGNIVLWFACAYIFTNIITIFLFPSSLESSRYSGAANNPNQLMFYASSASLLLVIYHTKLAIMLVPIITWITLKSGSDAYLLTLFVTVVIYIFIYLLFGKRFSFGVGLALVTIISLILIYFVFANFLDEIVLIWQAADQGGSRSALLINGLMASLSSPIFGYGAGNFSGLDAPFESWEAHNTFLDLSMQFGLLFPFVIYIIFFTFLFNRIKNRFYLQAAFIAAFIVSGLFHFSGRHFFFWVEFAIFYYYVFYDKNNYKYTQNSIY